MNDFGTCIQGREQRQCREVEKIIVPSNAALLSGDVELGCATDGQNGQNNDIRTTGGGRSTGTDSLAWDV